MSDSTISNLPEATTPLAGTEIVPLVQEGETRRVVLAPIAVSGSAADLEAGTVPSARLGSGTADGTTFLRGDGVWSVPPGGEGGGAPAVRDEGSTIVAVPSALNFTGGGVTVTDAGSSVAEISIPAPAATDLSYTAATRVLASSTGADATLPLVTTSDAGLAPASGGGTSNFLRADGTWAAPAAAWTTIFKSSDEARTSTTTLAADSALQVALDASSTYVFRLWVMFSTHTTPDFKYDMTYTGSLTRALIMKTHGNAAGAFNSSEFFTQISEALPTSGAIGGGTGSNVISNSGTIVTNTAGTLEFRWAQNVSDGNATTVRAGSYLEYRKI